MFSNACCPPIPDLILIGAGPREEKEACLSCLRNQLPLTGCLLKIRETNHVSLSMSMKKGQSLKTNCLNEFSHKVKNQSVALGIGRNGVKIKLSRLMSMKRSWLWDHQAERHKQRDEANPHTHDSAAEVLGVLRLGRLFVAVWVKNCMPSSLVAIFSESTRQPQSDHQKYSFRTTFTLYLFLFWCLTVIRTLWEQRDKPKAAPERLGRRWVSAPLSLWKWGITAHRESHHLDPGRSPLSLELSAS